MTLEEYEEQQRRLSEDIEDARQALNLARSRYERLCEKSRNLRIEWQEQQKAAKATPPTPAHTASGLATKTPAYPCRIKPQRGRRTHAATYETGSLSLTTACGQTKDEEAVDHLDEDTPITCPPCQRAVREW
ncbi:hypothetical protein JBE04_01850 [Streptomyces sp. PRKS01-29]|nr:hypothetical protein [Streptomyces sabulosicollis]MBI0293271.1 hypothetical protein [Streptomyces sabulosicollis]